MLSIENTNLQNFYKYGLLEMIHELGNMIQKMICISYEMESQGVDTAKLNNKINAMTQMIKIYTGLNTESTYSFEEMIEMIELFHNSPIILNGNFMERPNQNFINLQRVLLLYAMWISKLHELTINVIDNNNAEIHVTSLLGDDLQNMYAIKSDSHSIYPQMLANLSELKVNFAPTHINVQVD